MKYLNDPYDGCIVPQNHPVFIPKDEIDSFLRFSGDGLIINFPCKHVLHEKTLDWKNFWLLSGCPQEFSTIFSHHDRSRMTQLIMPNKEFIFDS